VQGFCLLGSLAVKRQDVSVKTLRSSSNVLDQDKALLSSWVKRSNGPAVKLAAAWLQPKPKNFSEQLFNKRFKRLSLRPLNRNQIKIWDQ